MYGSSRQRLGHGPHVIVRKSIRWPKAHTPQLLLLSAHVCPRRESNFAHTHLSRWLTFHSWRYAHNKIAGAWLHILLSIVFTTLREVSCSLLAMFGDSMVLFAKLRRPSFLRAFSPTNTSTPHFRDSINTTRPTLKPPRTVSHILRDITDRIMVWPETKLPQTLQD